LKQKVKDIGQLLDSQQRFCNKGFLQIATDALSGAEEMLRACKAHENSTTPLQPNKYTIHYNKRGEHLA
ncbi:hypothetical protein A0J61_09938, partial [Choanephora cucurbitarum]